MKAQINRYAGLILMGLFGVTALISFNCAPPSMTPEERQAYEDSLAQARQDSLLQANRARCEFLLSNGYEYYKQQNWENAIENYEQVRELGCGPGMAENLYLYLGNAYREVGNQDSAIAVYSEGREHLPENVYILQNLAYMYEQTNELEAQIEAQENLVELDGDNVEYLTDLSELYFDNNQFEERREVLERILEIEPNNASAQSSLIQTLERLGIDPIQQLRTRWENNPESATYGMDYGQELVDRSEYEEAVDVFEDVTSIDSSNLRAWTLLAQSYEALEQYRQAINAYQGILDIDPNRKDIIYEVSGLYVELGEFQEAMEWATRCIETGSENGMGYAARGRVYENLAVDCAADPLDFQDKLVYQMAYEDYQQAVSMGFGRISSRVDYVENFIPAKGDWFFHSDEGDEITPDKECYNWLNRSVQRPR